MVTKYEHFECALKEMGKNPNPYVGFTSYLFLTKNYFDEEQFDEKPFSHGRTYPNGLTVEHFEAFMDKNHLAAINTSLGEIQLAWQNGNLFKSQELNDLTKEFNYKLTYRILEHCEYHSDDKELMLLVGLISNQIPVENENHFIQLIGFCCTYKDKMEVSFNSSLKNINVMGYCPLNITYPIYGSNSNIECYDSYSGDFTLVDYKEKLKKQKPSQKQKKKAQPISDEEISIRMECFNQIIQSYMCGERPAYELLALLIKLDDLSLGGFGVEKNKETGQFELMLFSGERHKENLVSTPCFKDGELNHQGIINQAKEIKELIDSGLINVELVNPSVYYKIKDGFDNGEKYIFCNTIMGRARQHFSNEEKIMVALKLTANPEKNIEHFKNAFDLDDSLLEKYKELLMIKDFYFDFCINASPSHDGKNHYVSMYVAHGYDDDVVVFSINKYNLSFLDSLKWKIGYFLAKKENTKQFCEFEPLFRLAHKPMLSLMEYNPSIKEIIVALKDSHPIPDGVDFGIFVRTVSCDGIVLPIEYIKDDILKHSWLALDCSLTCEFADNYDDDEQTYFLQVNINNAPDEIKKTFKLLKEVFFINK